MGFAQNLQYLMDSEQITNYRLAKDVGCHATTVAHWLSGTSEPQKKQLVKIAERFGVTVDSLLGEEFPQKIKSDPVTVDSDKVEEIIRLFLTLPQDAQDRVMSYLRFEHSQL